jgi:microcompartment protein CcmK/EutM
VEYGEIIGTVVATRKVPAWHGQRLLLVLPGQRVFFVRGREAAHAIDDVFNPADAAIVAQVDRLEGPVAEAR